MTLFKHKESYCDQSCSSLNPSQEQHISGIETYYFILMKLPYAVPTYAALQMAVKFNQELIYFP